MKILMSCLLLSATLSAQGFNPPTTTNINYVTFGLSYEIRGVEAMLDNPGNEILVFLPANWVFTVGRWHPTKHGFSGGMAGPGLCVEPWTTMEPHGPVWHYNATLDVTGDGLSDFVVYLQDGSVDVYAGRGLSSCR